MTSAKPLVIRLLGALAWWKYLFFDRFLGRGYPEGQTAWDDEYAGGHWDKLSSLTEAGRFGVAAGYIAYLKPQARILDLGCGTGLLLRYLPPSCLESYHGVDLSQQAINQALLYRYPEHIRFERQAIEEFISPGPYDVIIFNEVLYYLDQPMEVIRKYSAILADDGLIIVSMVDPSGHYIWQQLKKRMSVLDWQKITNASGLCWHVGAFRWG